MADDLNTLDLDSLDQLLDAAEAAEAQAEVVPGADANAWPDIPDLDATEVEVTDVPLPVTEAPTTAVPVVPEIDVAPVVAAVAAAAVDVVSTTTNTQNQDKDDLPMRSRQTKLSSKKVTNEAWTKEEMDAIKKLIIIFGSTTLVLILVVLGVSVSGLVKIGAPPTKLIEAIDESKSNVEETYKLTEDSHKQIKALAKDVSDVASALSDTSALLNDVKAAQAEQAELMAKASKPVSSPASKQMSAAERKAAKREEIQQANLAPEGAEGIAGENAEAKVEMPADSAQVMAMGADIKDVKKRLAAAQKALEDIQKQSIALQQQSQQMIDAVKAVEAEVKARNKVVQVVMPKPSKTSDQPVSKERVAPMKPIDDEQARARWINQMDKSESFP